MPKCAHVRCSPSVVKLLDAFTFRGHYCLVMELLERSLLAYTMRGMAGQESHEHMRATARRDHHSDNSSRPRLLDQRSQDPSLGRRSAHEITPATIDRSPQASSGWGGSVGLGLRTPPSADTPKVPTQVIRQVALQLVSALLLLHNQGLVHADIKPENVLLRVDGEHMTATLGQKSGTMPFSLEDIMHGGARWNGCSTARLTVKLCDFGNAIHSTEARLYYDDFEIQTLAYRAPEVRLYQTMKLYNTWEFKDTLVSSIIHVRSSKLRSVR